MRKLVLFFVAMVFFQMGYSQNKKNQEVDIVSHTVQMGETIRMLSKKYLVDPSEIYRLNKFAVDGIHQGDVLQIPVPKKEPVIQQEEPVTEATPETVEEVHSQEAPPVEEAPKAKPQKAKSQAKPVAKEEPVAKEQPVAVIGSGSETQHTVEAGETLYSLSRKYGVTVDEIKMSNGDALKKGLKVGQVVQIPSAKTIDGNDASIGSSVMPSNNNTAAVPSEPKAAEAISPNPESTGNAVTHKVEPKETLYSLSKKYGVTVDDIKNQNPDVAQKGLQIGQTLTIRKN